VGQILELSIFFSPFDNLIIIKGRMRFFEGLKRQFVMVHVSGIPVRADYRWFFVIGLMTAIVAASLRPFSGSWGLAFVFGLVTTLIFFLSIFLHEYAHAAVAKMEDLRVIEIVLHPFGGLTRFSHEPETPGAEFRIAIAGPVASFVLAVLFALLATAASAAETEILIILAATLAIGNFLLAVFNLFPGYPLDGGRVLRAYLWRSGKDLSEATILTGRCGQAIAGVMILFGLLVAPAHLWLELGAIFLVFPGRCSVMAEPIRSRPATRTSALRRPWIMRFGRASFRAWNIAGITI